MKKTEKKEKPVPRKCICGGDATFVRTRSGKMFSCPNPLTCEANLRTSWKKTEDAAITEWNATVESFQSRKR